MPASSAPSYTRARHGRPTASKSFHLRSLRRILGISWRDKVPNTEVLDRADLPTMYTLLRQRRMCWIGHLSRMEDGRIPKDILYGELAAGKRPRGRPLLRYKDVCKRDMKDLEIDPKSWEDIAVDRSRYSAASSISD